MKGAKRRTNRQKLADGVVDESRLNFNEPDPDAKAPPIDHKEFEEILTPRGQWSLTYAPLIRCMIEAEQMMNQATASTDKFRWMGEFRRCLLEFGLSPVSNSKVEVKPKKETQGMKGMVA